MWSDSLFDLPSVLVLIFKGAGTLFFFFKCCLRRHVGKKKPVRPITALFTSSPNCRGKKQSVCLFTLRDMRGLNWVTEFLMSYSLFTAELRSHFSRFPPSPFSLHHLPPIYLLIRVSSIINSAFLKLIRVVLCQWCCCCCCFLFSHTRPTCSVALPRFGSVLWLSSSRSGDGGVWVWAVYSLHTRLICFGYMAYTGEGFALVCYTWAVRGCCVSTFRCVGVCRLWFFLFSTIKPLQSHRCKHMAITLKYIKTTFQFSD